jgi:fumarate hydratase, class II
MHASNSMNTGITLDQARIEKYVGESLMLVTALNPVIGYDKASAIAHQALNQNITLREAALKSEFISAEEFDRIVDPKKMVDDPRRDLRVASLTWKSGNREI